MKPVPIVLSILLAGAISGIAAGGEPEQTASSAKLKTRNILLVTSDGLRWQEVFGGVDPALSNREARRAADPARGKSEGRGNNRESSRKLLMPFFWTTIAKEGQVFGNVNIGSVVRVTNGKNFSYPGYNEILTGSADPRIDSNDKIPNRNVTVLEWLNGQNEFRSRVAVFGSWDVFPYIVNEERSHIPVVAGWKPLSGKDLSKEELLIGRLMARTPRMWDGCCYDSFIFQAAHEYFKRQRPRVLYLALGETDEFAHEGRYEQYLRASQNADFHLKTLWDTVQAMPDYRGTTTLIVTSDHGRGNAPVGWKSHGANVEGSDKIWIAVIGPDTAPLGERARAEPLTQGQVAATIAALLGLDYRSFAKNAAPPITSVIGR